MWEKENSPGMAVWLTNTKLFRSNFSFVSNICERWVNVCDPDSCDRFKRSKRLKIWAYLRSPAALTCARGSPGVEQKRYNSEKSKTFSKHESFILNKFWNDIPSSKLLTSFWNPFFEKKYEMAWTSKGAARELEVLKFRKTKASFLRYYTFPRILWQNFRWIARVQPYEPDVFPKKVSIWFKIYRLCIGKKIFKSLIRNFEPFLSIYVSKIRGKKSR